MTDPETDPVADPAPAPPVVRGPLRVGGRVPEASGARSWASRETARLPASSENRSAEGPPATDHPDPSDQLASVDRPARSVPQRGGGFDRVGGSRLTGPGAVVLAAVVLGATSPPPAADSQLFTVVWASLAAVLAIGIVVPLVLVRRVRIDATSPRDAVAGEEVGISVTVVGRSAGLEVRVLDPTGPWHRASAPARGDVRHLADRRGLFQVIRIEVRVTAPLGMLAAHRVHSITLPHAVEVAPRSLAVTWLPAPAPADGGTYATSLPTLTGDLVRSVRPYVSGDPPHLVHWPSSARLGELVVRELEPPVPAGQAVVLDLRDLGPDTERAASYALGACRAVLASGGQLVLATCEARGPVVGPVRTQLDAGRRLARAVPGQPAVAPEGWPVVEIGA